MQHGSSPSTTWSQVALKVDPSHKKKKKYSHSSPRLFNWEIWKGYLNNNLPVSDCIIRLQLSSFLHVDRKLISWSNKNKTMYTHGILSSAPLNVNQGQFIYTQPLPLQWKVWCNRLTWKDFQENSRMEYLHDDLWALRNWDVITDLYFLERPY